MGHVEWQRSGELGCCGRLRQDTRQSKIASNCVAGAGDRSEARDIEMFDSPRRLVQAPPNGREGIRSMTYSQINRSLLGPYGLHAYLAVALGLFVGFLYVFNFTSFF